jgi:hypothetical protein
MDFVDGQIAFDQDHAIRFARSDFAVFLPDAAVKSIVLGFEAILVFAGFGFDAVVAPAGAGQRNFEAGQEKQSQVGLQVSANEAMQIEHGGRAKFAAPALISLG